MCFRLMSISFEVTNGFAQCGGCAHRLVGALPRSAPCQRHRRRLNCTFVQSTFSSNMLPHLFTFLSYIHAAWLITITQSAKQRGTFFFVVVDGAKLQYISPKVLKAAYWEEGNSTTEGSYDDDILILRLSLVFVLVIFCHSLCWGACILYKSQLMLSSMKLSFTRQCKSIEGKIIFRHLMIHDARTNDTKIK